jgi:uncharacterized lipoprotein YajG
MQTRQLLSILLMAAALLAMGCATTADYSGYSTQQLRQQLALERQTVSFHGQKVDQRQYQAVYGNEDSTQNISASGGFLHALASRVHYNRAKAIEQELMNRGENP